MVPPPPEGFYEIPDVLGSMDAFFHRSLFPLGLCYSFYDNVFGVNRPKSL